MKKGLLSLLYSLDKRIWGDQINPNKYMSTGTLLICILLGILWGGSSFLNGMFDLDINIYISATLAIVSILTGYNIAESIIATNSAKIATMRSLMMAGFMILGVILGVIGSVILLAILTIIICIYLIFIILTGSTYGGGQKKWKLDNGDVVTEEKGMFGEKYYTGSSGQNYETDNDGESFREK